ncbi:hypothetical protein K4F52_004934 [Lecanicillium sp. MT-2017a]|nr:hypothetical protein K4F52_004934 [Lecanicillium sp. MT-2017a]
MVARKLSRTVAPPSATSTYSFSTISPTSTTLPASLCDPSLPLPKLIVFDLDYTLWPFWVDTHVTPPLKPNGTHTAAADRYGEDYAFYADVPGILALLPHAGDGSPETKIRLGVASRTSAPSLARDLLKMLHVPGHEEGDKPRKALEAFDGGVEIYPGSKIRHFETLQKRSGIRYEDMLFFDDESRNMETEKLGVTMKLVRDGVTWDEVESGIELWRKRRGHGKSR